MSKRKAVSFDENEATVFKKSKETEIVKKHSLDSDEEDENDDAYNILNDDDIEGEEDGISRNEDGVRTTAFNMREEMEEGYFDKDGHFVFKKKEDIRDNWLDNIDWHNIKNTNFDGKSQAKSLGDESDSDEEDDTSFNEIECYNMILQYMQPKESITKSLRRLGGGNKRLSSVERLKLKKAGILDANNEKVTQLTELANNLLNKTGNMDIYEETYEQILQKIKKPAVAKENDELDMYSEDFDKNEKRRLDDPGPSTNNHTEPDRNTALMWEFKWSQKSEKIEGPNTTEQMQKLVDEGKFKDGVWVRKCGQDQFYSSSRIDFELYLS